MKTEKSIVQMTSVLLQGDAISNVIKILDNIHKEQRWKSNIMVELFSEYPDTLVLVSKDYDKTPYLFQLFYSTKRFLLLSNKLHWLRLYFKAKKSYKSSISKNFIEKADIRIWHYGGFYVLFRVFHDSDIIFFYGITPPYLTYSSESAIYSKLMLQSILDLHPFVIVESKFIKQSLVELGFKEQSIHVLPLFHKYKLPYKERHPAKPKLIAWGRYALNKGIPELVDMANEHKIRLRVFGDNYQLREFSDQYKEALKANTSGYAILSGKVPDFEAELNQANIYISNSYHEGFNMPLIEAEAHSLPVLARKGTAMDELVKDGYNGYLFSDISEVPELINKIMKDYKRFSFNAWKHSQNFTYERFKERYLRIIEKYKK